MGIAHFLDIFCQLYGKLAVRIEALVLPARMAHPGTGMHLINRHRLAVNILAGLGLLHPFAIAPLKCIDICYAGGVPWTQLRIVGIRVCLIELPSIRRLNIEFIQIPHRSPWNKKFINTHRLQAFHHVRICLPVIKRADYGYFFCIRRPYGEIHALFPFFRDRMRT